MSSTRISVRIDAPRDRVYRAFVEANTVAAWMVPTGMTSHVHAFEGREGGAFRISLTYDATDAKGKSSAHTDTYHGRFVELVPGERMVEVMEFETADPGMQGEMTMTVTLADADGNAARTELVAVHDGLPPGVSAADNEMGWRISLGKLAKLAEGNVALHVEASGSGDPVVLLHSSGLSGRQWRRLAATFVEKGHRAIVPDLTGHGASPAWPEPKPFSFREDVAHVSKLLAGGAGGVGGARGAPAHVVGHSYGAFVALLAALAVPSSVRSLVLFEPVAFGALDPTSDAEARAELTKVESSWGWTAEAHERWLRGFVEYWGGEGAWSALREEARTEFRRVGWVLREGVQSLASDTTPASAYASLRCPVTLVTGELTPLAARRVVEQLAAAIPGARIVTIAGAGHMAPLSHGA
ncbi:MAG: hypothetical protein QOI41_5145, partial [Myxococcales bacterium]|nr:hypothetical protein [Myxococcales bacterium]